MTDCKCSCEPDRKDFWNWWKWNAKDKDIAFTLAEVLDLLEEIKEFNAGAVDEYLSKHVDKVLKEKLEEKTD